MVRVLAFGMLCAAALLLVGTAGAGGGKKVYKTPQEVFDAAKTAIKNNDTKTAMDCLTDEARDTLTGGVAFMALMAKGFGAFAQKDEEKEKLKKLDDVLNRHGLTEEYVKTLPKPQIGKKPSPEEIKEGIKKLVAPIKDRGGFVADVLALLPSKDGKKGGPFEELGGNPKLEDVKVTGDRAKGEMVGMKDGKEVRKPIDFKKEGGGWKIDIDPTKMMEKKGAKGSPGSPTAVARPQWVAAR